MKITPLRRFGIAALAAMLLAAIAAPAPSEASVTSGFAFTEAVGFADPVDNPVLLADASAFLVTDVITYDTGWLDARAYNSLALDLRAEGGTYLDTDLVEVTLDYAADSAGANITFQDRYRIYRTNILNSSRFRLTDPVHGAWVRMRVGNLFAAPRNFNLTFSLYGSYRSVPATWLRTAPDGIILEQRAALLGAGLSVVNSARLGYGRAMASLLSGAGGGATFTIVYGGSTITDVLTVPGANTRITKEIVMPRWQPRITITNNGAAASTIDVHIIQQGYPQ